MRRQVHFFDDRRRPHRSAPDIVALEDLKRFAIDLSRTVARLPRNAESA
jgi:hypothetical protein